MEEHIELETRLYIYPKRSRYFNVYREMAIPYQYQESQAKIELCEVVDLGYDYVMIPLQIYRTTDPQIYKLVAILDLVKCDTPYIPLVEINEENIRTYSMTKDGKVFLPKFEHIDPTKDDWEFNKKIEYQLVDISPKENYIRSCGLKSDFFVAERKGLPEQERVKLYLEEGEITYIKERFGFRERDIRLLPKKKEEELRFQVMDIQYVFQNGKLSIEQEETQ